MKREMCEKTWIHQTFKPNEHILEHVHLLYLVFAFKNACVHDLITVQTR